MIKRVVGATLSVLMPGTGHFYYHEWTKGAAFFVAAMLLSGIANRFSAGGPASEAKILHLALVGLAVWAAVDLFRTAKSK